MLQRPQECRPWLYLVAAGNFYYLHNGGGGQSGKALRWLGVWRYIWVYTWDRFCFPPQNASVVIKFVGSTRS